MAVKETTRCKFIFGDFFPSGSSKSTSEDVDVNEERRSDTENQTAAPRPSPSGETKVASLALPATRLLSSLNAKQIQIPEAVNNTQHTGQNRILPM